MTKQSSDPHPEVFMPDSSHAEQLATNRAGKLTRMQRNSIIIGALGSAGGLLCVLTLFVNVLLAWVSGIGFGGIISIVFFIFFGLSFGYLGLTLYFNASWFVPDMLSRNPVRVARGKLQIKMPARERRELPYSYIVGDYSFAPYDVPADVPMVKGREYVVYYAAHSRLFLNVEPADYADQNQASI